MASHSEIVLVDSAGQPAASKHKKKRPRRTRAPNKAKHAPSRNKSKPVNETQPTGADIVPVMKLRAIDSVDGANGAFDIPNEVNGERLVTDPELLELLEQLSVTIDTANTVLDAAATLPADEEESEGESAKPETAAIADQKAEPAPELEPEPAPPCETGPEDLPTLAARLAPKPAPAPAPARQKRVIGFGPMANTALTGLVFAAGLAWVLHTNPWLMEGKTSAPVKPGVAATTPDTKDQSSLRTGQLTLKRVAAAPNPVPASFSPPDDDPAPMETLTPPAPGPAVAAYRPARGPAGRPIALNISLPADPGGTEMSIMIQGVPDNARLSAGKSLGSGNWLLNEPQLKSVTLNTGEGFKPGNYELEVILVRSDGKVPETRKVPVAVEPVAVAAAASAQRAATEMSRLAPREVAMLLTRGDALLREGDVAGARLLLEYAANSGSKQAMVKLGNSYDPEHLSKLGVFGVQPNEARAVLWYDRAAKAGDTQ